MTGHDVGGQSRLVRATHVRHPAPELFRFLLNDGTCQDRHRHFLLPNGIDFQDRKTTKSFI